MINPDTVTFFFFYSLGVCAWVHFYRGGKISDVSQTYRRRRQTENENRYRVHYDVITSDGPRSRRNPVADDVRHKKVKRDLETNFAPGGTRTDKKLLVKKSNELKK